MKDAKLFDIDARDDRRPVEKNVKEILTWDNLSLNEEEPDVQYDVNIPLFKVKI